ncbi:MAG: flagellar biosynthesis regulator FlaF [Pseudomonadota bacterium]
MFIQAYEEVLSDEQGTVRESEREIISQTIESMQRCDAEPNDLLGRVKAIHFVREVWSYFLNDLASQENETPAELKASLISIGIFIMKHLEQMRNDKSVKFEPLVEISKSIEKGLE